MSIKALSEAIEPLPYTLSEQVLSYAKSLEAAAPQIFADAGIQRTRENTDKLVFIAGLRKLFSIMDGNYWVIDNASALLSKQANQYAVHVGGTDLSRGGAYHSSLRRMLTEFTQLLLDKNLMRHVRDLSYTELVREMSDGR